MITRAERFLDNRGMPMSQMLQSVLREHLAALPRLQRLGDYYRANNAIASRKRAEGLPNNRIAHPFARYIVSVATSYLIGQPASYSADGFEDALAPISEAYWRCSISSVDIENARHAAIYGRGVEYIHTAMNESTGAITPQACALSPEQAFVVYDDTHESKPLFGVYFTRNTREDGMPDGYHIWVMGRSTIVELLSPDLNAGNFSVVKESQHYFGGVPLVEYWNDEDEIGDFEWVIPLIDAYDVLQSDRVNDKQQFVDKLLLLYGCTLETDAQGRKPWQQLREDKALCLPDNDSRAEYLQGQMQEADVEVLRAALENDIHKLSLVPNMSDQNFAANASGVAMRYKLMGLDQLISVKQQWFIEGLRARLRLFANFSAVQGNPALDPADVKITLTRAMPANMLELAEIAQAADSAGAASTETKVRLLHSGDDWTEDQIMAEVDKIENEDSRSDPQMQMGNLLYGNVDPQLDDQPEGQAEAVPPEAPESEA